MPLKLIMGIQIKKNIKIGDTLELKYIDSL